MRFINTIACLSLSLAALPSAAASTWEIDPAHSSVGFVARHLVVAKVRGRFTAFSGTVVMDDKDLAKSSVNVTIRAASLSTDNDKRDEHLRSSDFFDTTKFPEATFVSTKVERGASPDALKITGDLTLHGVKAPVVLEVTGPSPEFKDPAGNPHLAFSATTVIKRSAFGLTWSKAVEAAPVVGEDIKLEFEMELKNKK